MTALRTQIPLWTRILPVNWRQRSDVRQQPVIFQLLSLAVSDNSVRFRRFLATTASTALRSPGAFDVTSVPEVFHAFSRAFCTVSDVSNAYRAAARGTFL